MGDLQQQMTELGKAAKAAAAVLANAPAEQKNQAIYGAAAAIRAASAQIEAENAKDMQAAETSGLSKPKLDRLLLTAERIEAMAQGLESVAAFDDPVGKELANWDRPNGLNIRRVATPLGVIGVIYESRPNVTADAGALCLKAGNATILRGGSDSIHSSTRILGALQDGLASAGLPREAIQAVPTTDREAVGMLLRMNDYVDVIVPRGGKGLVERVQNEAKVPVFSHLDGINHTYVDRQADLEAAAKIVDNAKLRRTSICGAVETLLVHQDVAQRFLPMVQAQMAGRLHEWRADPASLAILGEGVAATAEDWDTEYLDAILAVKVVGSLEEAIEHINRHGSQHTEVILTQDQAAADQFAAQVDAAIVMHNTSSQFADGGEFGMGAEIGISTGRMHARGPVGAAQLTTYKYIVSGSGQIRS